MAPRRAAIKPYVVWFLTEGFHESLEIVKVTVLHHHDFFFTSCTTFLLYRYLMERQHNERRSNITVILPPEPGKN